mgnify:CR=1 FL=1
MLLTNKHSIRAKRYLTCQKCTVKVIDVLKITKKQTFNHITKYTRLILFQLQLSTYRNIKEYFIFL